MESSLVPIILPKSGAREKIIVCQIDDPELSFEGELGAIGRISATSDQLRLDLKGRHYKGVLYPGWTVLQANLRTSKSSSFYVEGVTNEVCHLTLEKEDFHQQVGDASAEVDEKVDLVSQASKKRSRPVISTITSRSRTDKKGTKRSKK